MDIVEFLLARITEDEARVALVASAPPRWRMTVWPHDGDPIPVEVPPLTPERALAEYAAKRAIIAACRIEIVEDGERSDHTTEGDLAELTLRHLAVIYDDHPDYRDEWGPCGRHAE